MSAYTLLISVSQAQTRLLLTLGPDELLRAVLPHPSQVGHDFAAPTLLRGIATWLDRPLRVVLSVEPSQICSCLGLTDALGIGLASVFYTVDAVECGGRRRSGRRLRLRQHTGDFRQLHLLRRQQADGGAA